MRIISVDTNKDKDLEEIFLHVKKLKAEFDSIEKIKEEKLDDLDIIKNNNENIFIENIDNISPDDIFEIVDEQETVTKMEIKTSGMCDICGQDINFDENLSGLVLFSKFFACQECCEDASNDVLNSWIETRNAKVEDVKPIAFWLMKEMHKTRLI